VDISGSQGLACEFAEDVQKREFLGLDAKFEFTTHFDFSFFALAQLKFRRSSLSDNVQQTSQKMLSWTTVPT